MILKIILSLHILLFVTLIPFRTVDAAPTISDYAGTPPTGFNNNLYAVSSPCGVRLSWGFKNYKEWHRNPLNGNEWYTYPDYDKVIDVSIYRASNLQYEPRGPLDSKWPGHYYAAYPGLNIRGNAISAQMNSSVQIIFSGKIKASSMTGTKIGGFPLCPDYYDEYGILRTYYLCDAEYTEYGVVFGQGDHGFKFTDMNAVPGNTYYYIIVDNDTDQVIAGTSAYSRVDFERPEMVLDSEGEFSLARKTYGSSPADYCPFIHTPGSGGPQIPGGNNNNYNPISLRPSGIGGGLGGQIGDLSCSQDKYTFSVSRDTSYQQSIQNGSNSWRYGQDAFSRLYGQTTSQNGGGQQYAGPPAPRLSDRYDVSRYDSGYFDMTQFGATSYNFYRMVCDAGDPSVYHTGCILDKIEDQSEINIQEVYNDFFEVSFDNSNYTAPVGKQHLGYYVTSVYGGAESFPVALGSVSWLKYQEGNYDGEIYGWWDSNGKLPLCIEQCLDPNTIDPNTPITITSLSSGKKLHWDFLNNKLVQEDSNESDLNQKWYIRPSGDGNFAHIISANNGKVLSTNGFLDWSWQNWFNRGLWGWGYFPGINDYEKLGPYSLGGNSITQENLGTNDGQKWCIVKDDYPVSPDGYYPGIENISGVVDTYILLNKSTQSTLRPIASYDDGYAAPSFNSGAQVWLDLNNSSSYWGGPTGYPVSAIEYYEGRWLLPEISEFQSCPIPGGTTIPHGSSTTYYISDAINGDCDDSSNKEIRTCTNGTLSGTATSNSCTEYCVINGQNVYSGNSVSYYKNSTASTNEDCQSTNNKITYSCEDNGIVQPTVDSDYSKLYCTYSSVLEPKTLNLYRLVPNIVNLGQQCRGKVDTNEISTYGLNLATTTCDIYQVLNDNTPSNTKYSSGDPKSTTLTDWPLVDPGKDYRIICKDTAIPNYTTAISKTLKCILNPEVKEI